MEMYDYPPDFIFEETQTYNTIISRFENAWEQRRAKWSKPYRRFRLIYRNRSLSDYANVWSFFYNRMGRYEAFYFKHPISSLTYIVRFDQDEFTGQLIAPNRYDFEVVLREVPA